MENSEIIFKGRLLEFIVKRVHLPNGYDVELETVKHPGAALIIPFLKSDTVILLRQFRAVISTYLYEFPAGTIYKGESSLSCARREIIEETGYTAKKFIRLGIIYPVPGYSTEKITVYKAEDLKRVSQKPERDEIIQQFIMLKKDVQRLFRKGKIIDAKTIAALAMCGWL